MYLTARRYQTASNQSGNAAPKQAKNTNEILLSEEFINSFHEAAMEAAVEIKKGKKPRFVKVA